MLTNNLHIISTKHSVHTMYNLDIVNDNHRYTNVELTVLILKKSLFLSIKQWMDKQNMIHIHSMEYYLAIKRNGALTCYNMDEPWKHDAKSKNPHTKGCILHDSIYVKCPKQANP